MSSQEQEADPWEGGPLGDGTSSEDMTLFAG